MIVRMEHTEGLGREAQVWVGGTLLTVCDGISAGDARVAPGEIEGVGFSYMAVEGFNWDEAVRGNPSHKAYLDPVRRWSYVGYGRITQVMPVTVDFGLLQMEDANWTTDEALVGRFVRIPIDRLEITPANPADWPEGMA